jgi:ribonucleoside-triphosphate reductase
MVCPNCESKTPAAKRGKGIKFERIRRITGYLVGTLDKWNDAKKAEEKDRVKHSLGGKKDG